MAWTRDQMAELIRSLASKDTVDGMAADMSRRWEENRKELDRRFDEHRGAIHRIVRVAVHLDGAGLERRDAPELGWKKRRHHPGARGPRV